MDIVEKKFEEWIGDLSPTNARISIFEHIRDVSYFVDPALWDLRTGPVKMLEQGKGSCTPKHYLLGMMLRKMQLDVRFSTYPFNWRELDVAYPPDLKIMAERLPVTYHLACRVLVEGKWVLLDATWDKGLMGSGFPVNESWDGFSDTRLAVKALEEITYKSAEERDKAFKGSMESYSLSQKLQLSRFSIELDKWLEVLRAEKGSGEA